MFGSACVGDTVTARVGGYDKTVHRAAPALREKKYKLGFIASGDHNSIGVGLACIWVKEIESVFGSKA